MVMLLMMISPTVAELKLFLWLAVAIRSLMLLAVALNYWPAVGVMRVLFLAIVMLLLLAIAID